MPRFLFVLTWLLAMAAPLHAGITDPELLRLATSYRPAPSDRDGGLSTTDLLIRLAQAREAGNDARAIALSETLVSRNEANAEAWIALAKAWLASDGTAQKGLSAALTAARIAPEEADRLEAFLTASTFLRNRLAAERRRFDAAAADGAAASRGLEQAVYAVDKALIDTLSDASPDDLPKARQAVDRKAAELGAADPKGRAAALLRMRDQAEEARNQASDAIGEVARLLDAVYREIQAAVPSLQVAEMQAGDKRIGFFVERTAQDKDRVELEVVGQDVRACVVFSQPLEENSRIYNDMAVLTAESGPVEGGSAVQAKGNRLCFLRVEPGASYTAKLSPELPSAEGSLLGQALEVAFNVPDIPARVDLGRGQFILPRSGGPGEVKVTLTNVETFDIAIHRIVDRSINRQLALEQMGGSISAEEHSGLLADFSEPLWEGKATRANKSTDRNNAVDTFVPVKAILDARKKWLSNLSPSKTRSGVNRSPVPETFETQSDPSISVEGRSVAGALDANEATRDRFVPGVYALSVPQINHTHVDPAPAQWFVVTDIGLTFYEGSRDFDVVARSLQSGGAIEGATIQLVSRGNRVLDTKTTDKNGVARFDRSLTAGDGSNTLLAIMAETGSDFNYLRYNADRLDLSRLNLGRSGGPAGTAVLYTDRGIYQPDDEIGAFALLRDRVAAGPPVNAQLRLQIGDSDVAIHTLGEDEWQGGGLLASLKVPSTARPGTATLKLVSAANGTLAETRIEIGSIRPDRAQIDFAQDSERRLKAVPAGDVVDIVGEIRARYLYGLAGTDQGAAVNLRAEVAVEVHPVPSPVEGCFAGFSFGRFDDAPLPMTQRDLSEHTDDRGFLSGRIEGVKLPQTTRPLAADVQVTLFDASGPLASGEQAVAIPTRDVALGLSKVPRIRSENGGYAVSLDLLALDPAGRTDLDRIVDITVERERDFYVWRNVAGEWQPEPSRQTVRVSEQKNVALRALAPGQQAGNCAAPLGLDRVATGLTPGRYVATVRDTASGAEASLRFNTGVAQTLEEDLEPNIFVLSTDKARYAPSETVSLAVEAPYASGQALVAIAAGPDVVSWVSGRVEAGKATVSVPLKPEWAGRGLYALATVFRSDAQTGSEGEPARAIGAAYFEVAADTAGFAPRIQREESNLAGILRPQEALDFDVCLGAADGSCERDDAPEAFAVAFVVDAGLLSLTQHAALADELETELIGKERFGLRLMDNYGRLMLKEGGDRPGRLALTNYKSPRIVSASAGPVRLEKGRAHFSFSDPGLPTGRLVIQVIAWSGAQAATAREDVVVRPFLVADLGLPAFVSGGDKPLLALHFENIDLPDASGSYRVGVSAGPIAARLLRSDGSDLPKDGSGRFLLPIRRGVSQDALLALDVPEALGKRQVLALDISAPAGAEPLPPTEARRTWNLDVRPLAPALVRYRDMLLGAGETDIAPAIKALVDAEFQPETATVAASFASHDDAVALASRQEAVPGGDQPILERMVWSGMVDLGDRAEAAAQARVQSVVEGVQALQVVDGSFVPYRTAGDFSPAESNTKAGYDILPTKAGLLRTASAADFLLRADKAGYSVSGDAVERALGFMERQVEGLRNSSDASDDLKCSFGARYAMLLLAGQDRLTSASMTLIESCADIAQNASGETDEGADEGVASENEEGEDLQPATTISADTAFSDLVSYAVAREFGEEDPKLAALYAPDGAGTAVLGSLDGYRKAVAISLLVNAKADREVVQAVSQTIRAGGEATDLRTRAWLARSAADLGGNAAGGLRSEDLSIDPPASLALRDKSGVVVTDAIPYSAVPPTLSVAAQAGVQVSLRVAGLGRSAAATLDDGMLRRRAFDAETGQEVDLSGGLRLGQKLIVVLEGTRGLIDDLNRRRPVDLGQTSGALSLDSPLPSAFALVAENTNAIRAKGDFASLPLAGSLRSIGSHAQGWKAIIVPRSNMDAKPAAGGQEAEGEGEEDAEASAEGAETPEAGGAESAAPEAEPDLEFRQAFVVAVTAAGSFRFPPPAVDPVDFPDNTLVGAGQTFAVALPTPGIQP